MSLSEVLRKKNLEKDDIVYLLSLDKSASEELFEYSSSIRRQYCGNKVFLRGIIEFSNICRKDCYYCGIRKSNKNVERYILAQDDILRSAQYAYHSGMGSLVLQAGERNDKWFVDFVSETLEKIKQLSNGKLGITLSLGEQTEETFARWFEAGAHRYLLRIEVSNPDLYYKFHPQNKIHDYNLRLDSLYTLKKLGYQTGTGVMIGLPGQDLADLADDLLFFREFDVDMVGMGPYIPHKDTPLYTSKELLMSDEQRFFLSLKMVAILRIMMPDINIAATTAMQTLHPFGREIALEIGANVLMPNITPSHRKDYFLYENKPCVEDGVDDCLPCLENRLKAKNLKIEYNLWGDSLHFKNKRKINI